MFWQVEAEATTRMWSDLSCGKVVGTKVVVQLDVDGNYWKMGGEIQYKDDCILGCCAVYNINL